MNVMLAFAGYPWAIIRVENLDVYLGAATLNQLIELRFDAQMRRTARRPIASRRSDCRLWPPRLECLAAVCNRLSLAISPLHGDRLDLSRRLRRASHSVLPAGELADRFVAWQSSVPPLTLFASAFVPVTRGEAGLRYFGGLVIGSRWARGKFSKMILTQLQDMKGT